MELYTGLIIETFAATLHALSSGRTLPAPQDFPVERAYTKFIFNLENKENEDELEVVIKAKMRIIFDDCNTHTPPSSALVKSAAGYYFIDFPGFVSTTRACQAYHVELIEIVLSNHVFEYDSRSPIVIHAFHGIHVEHEIRRKTASVTTSE